MMIILRMNKRGAALVEFAIVAVLLITLAIGIIDFGLLAKDRLALGSAARDGARAASVGRSAADITQVVKSSAPELNGINVLCYYREQGGDWQVYADKIPDTVPSSGVQVKVVVNCTRAPGTMFGTDSTLSAEMIMERE